MKFEEQDKQLFDAINDYQNGKKKAASVIYQNTKKYSYKIIYEQVSRFKSENVLTGDVNAITEDVMQEMYLEFFKTIDQFRNADLKSFYKWITVVSHRMVLKFVDKNKMEVLRRETEEENSRDELVGAMDELSNEDVDGNQDFNPESVAMDRELKKILSQFMKELPEVQSQTLLYHVYGGLKYQEIADLMGVSLITVKTRIKKAKDSMKEMLCQYEEKSGTKLHSVAILPLLLLLFRKQVHASKMPLKADLKMFNVLHKTLYPTTLAPARALKVLVQTAGTKSAVAAVVITVTIATGSGVVIQQIQDTIQEQEVLDEETEEQVTEEELQQKEEVKEEDTKQEEITPEEVVQDETEQEDTQQVTLPEVEGQYFFMWNEQYIDINSYVYQDDYYTDATYGYMRRWWVNQRVLTNMGFSQTQKGDDVVFYYQDILGNETELIILGNNLIQMNGKELTRELDVKEINGEKYVNPYHLMNNVIGSTSILSNTMASSTSIGGIARWYTEPTETPEPQIKYQNGDSYAVERYNSIVSYLQGAEQGSTLTNEGTSLSYFNQIFVSRENEDGAWMFLQVNAWETNSANEFSHLPTVTKGIMNLIVGESVDSENPLFDKIESLIQQYTKPEAVPTQGVVTESIDGLYVTLTQDAWGMQIRFFAE